jgi:hypothetical protein
MSDSPECRALEDQWAYAATQYANARDAVAKEFADHHRWDKDLNEQMVHWQLESNRLLQTARDLQCNWVVKAFTADLCNF